MALFGVGYALAKGVGVAVKLFTGEPEAGRWAEVAMAVCALPVDPLGAAAAIGMPFIKQGAVSGDHTCQKIVAYTQLLDIADLATSGVESVTNRMLEK